MLNFSNVHMKFDKDVLSDINKKRKEFYVDEETDKSVFHDNRYDSGNR